MIFDNETWHPVSNLSRTTTGSVGTCHHWKALTALTRFPNDLLSEVMAPFMKTIAHAKLLEPSVELQ